MEHEALVLKYWLKRGAGKGSRGRKTGDGCGTVSSAEGAEMDCEEGTHRAQKRGGGSQRRRAEEREKSEKVEEMMERDAGAR